VADPRLAAWRARADFEQAIRELAGVIEADHEQLRRDFLDWIRTTPMSLSEGIDVVRQRGEVPPPR
jgi:hypothetical protein